MSVLELERVAKRFRKGRRELVALTNVSLEIETGEVVCVTGARGSGRTTLLRVAAGIEQPDEGRVNVAGVDLRTAGPEIRRQIVVCNMRFLPAHGRDIAEHVMMPLLAVHVSRDEAGLRAHRALKRVGAEELAFETPDALIPSELVRVALARAVVREPRVLLLDEPANGVDALEREPLLALIQQLARSSGTAVLLTAGETTSVTGADRVLRLSEGELLGRTVPESADVVQLRRPSSSEASS